LKWKKSIDDNIDTSEIPILLIENKADLVPDYSRSAPEFESFAKTNNFVGAFRTSAKTGLNVNESMETLINMIIKNIEDKANIFKDKRQSIILDRTMDKKKRSACC
jgi:50S ribosomal subunit-associated GTPase HflX